MKNDEYRIDMGHEEEYDSEFEEHYEHVEDETQDLKRVHDT